MRKIFILFLFLPFWGIAQPAEVAAKRIRATEKLQLSNKTLTAIVESITVLSTHAQSPTAKAVYDLTAAMITSVSTNATLSGNGTTGDPLKIAQQSAASGQVLKWNGTTWIPANDDNTTQALSYSAPNLSLSGGGGTVAIPQGTVTGTGSTDFVPKFSGASSLTNSILSNTGQQVKLAYNDNAFQRGLLLQNTNTNSFAINGMSFINAAGSQSGNIDYFASNYANSSIADFLVTNTLGSTAGILFNTNIAGSSGAASGNIKFKTGGNTNSAIFVKGSDGSGFVGINTESPARSLHVNGVARINGSGSSATSIAGRDANNDITGVTIGAGLSLSGGTLSSTATGTVGGTGTAGKVAYWSGTNTLTSTANFAFDGTNLAVGTPTAGGGRLRVVGNSTSVGLQVDAGTLPSFGSQLQSTATTANGNSILGLDFTGTTTGSTTNYLHKLENNGTGSNILQMNVAAAGGSPMVQYNTVSGSGNWVHGMDKADANKFKIKPYTGVGASFGATGLTITTAGLFGINKEAPEASLDMDATTDGIAMSSGNTANRPTTSLRWLRYNTSMQGLETRTINANWHVLTSANSVNLTSGTGLGTAPTITINNGTEMAYTVSLTVGAAPTANAVIYTRTLASTWSVAPTVVFSAANQLTASEITKFYVDTQTTGSYTIRANGTLTAGQTYKLNIQVRN